MSFDIHNQNTVENIERIKSRADLLKELDILRGRNFSEARKLEMGVEALKFSAIFFAACSLIIGIVAKSSFVTKYLQVEPWMISILTGAAGGIEVFRANLNWRDKSNTFYALRDEVESLVLRLSFEIPNPPTPDQIALISKELRDAKRRCGDKMHALNKNERATKSQASPLQN